MTDYQMGGGLKQVTAIDRTQAFSDFLKNRLVLALEAEDPTELHYRLGQLDDTIPTCGGTIRSCRPNGAIGRIFPDKTNGTG